ncbi:hypothetical protein FOWG_09226 [Fusarium oxysporum f. sp. lycopersici MN25]|nr:hypothetical protein FOWG_09226 [Fusarium oxysporum f. sp. lycopersici MN25]
MPQLFEPKPGQENLFIFDKTPTYLFRLHVPRSKGDTSTVHVMAPAFLGRTAYHRDRLPCGEDLLQLPTKIATSRLKDHLRWKCNHLKKSPCNLMSWSSSLLFLLQYALYRHTTDFEPKPQFPNIKIIMIDTRDFPEQTFLRDLDALEWLHEEPDPVFKRLYNNRNGRFYFGEYLTQGYLDITGKCVEMTMQQLVDGGLFTVICPALDKPQNDWKEWPKAVCNRLRVDIASNKAVDQKQIRTAIFLARDCVGDRFLVPLALMLLGLRSRQSDNAAIANAFHSLFTDKELVFRGVKYDQSSERMEELRRFQELMEVVKKQHDDNSLAVTTRLMEGLGLSTNEMSTNPTKTRIYVGPFGNE